MTKLYIFLRNNNNNNNNGFFFYLFVILIKYFSLFSVSE